MNELYVWCMMNWGHLPDSRYTGTLQKQSEVSMCALWMSAIGSRPPRDQEEGWFGGPGRLPYCCGLNGFFGARSTCVSALWQCEVGAGGDPACLAPIPGERVPYHPQSAVQGQTGFRAGLTPFRSLSRSAQTPPVTVWQELFWCFLVQLLNVQCVM